MFGCAQTNKTRSVQLLFGKHTYSPVGVGEYGNLSGSAFEIVIAAFCECGFLVYSLCCHVYKSLVLTRDIVKHCGRFLQCAQNFSRVLNSIECDADGSTTRVDPVILRMCIEASQRVYL